MPSRIQTTLAGRLIFTDVLFGYVSNEAPNREAIRDAKDVCAGCGAELVGVGPSEGDRRGFAEFECSRESCGYKEIRLYGANYYEYADE